VSIIIVVLIIVCVVFAAAALVRPVSAPSGSRNPNAYEPDVFANPDADLDPESDTGEPDGWN